jgi:hypothetical protein
MDAATLFLGAGQLALGGILCYLLYLLRRDARRSSLVAIVAVLNDLREKNAKALMAVFALTSSQDYQRSDEPARAALIDSTNRLRAIQDSVTEALLQTIRQCDAEWRLAGRLHAAVRAQLDHGSERHSDLVATQDGLARKGCA